MGHDRSDAFHQSGRTSGLPTLCFVQQAATRFKKGASGNQKISREKRELIRKIGEWQQYKCSRHRLLSELQEVVKPFIEQHQKGIFTTPSVVSEAENDDCEPPDIGICISESIQGIVDSFCDEAVHLCCERWEVDKLSCKLVSAKETAAKLERENREAHQRFMKELQVLKDKNARLQNRDARNVSIGTDDVVFYEATMHLDEDQRNLVKEMVEYKVKAELDKVENGAQVADGSQALREQLKEQAASLADLRERLENSPSRSQASSYSPESRQFAARMGRRMSCPATTTQEFRPQTPPRCEERSRRALMLERMATLESQVSQTEKVDSCTQTVSLPEPRPSPDGLMVSHTKRNAHIASQTEPWTASSPRELGVSKEEQRTTRGKSSRRERVNDIVQDDFGLLDHLARAAEDAEVQDLTTEETERTARKSGVHVRETYSSPSPSQSPKGESKAYTEFGESPNAVATVGREIENMRKAADEKDKIIEQLKDKVCLLERANAGNATPLESALAKTVQQEELVSLRSEVAAKTSLVKELEAEGKRLQEEVEILRGERSEVAMSPTSPEARVNTDNSMLKATEEISMLRKEALTLADELHKQQQTNGKLEISLNEMREKLKNLLEQLKQAGLGHIVDRIFESVGLSEFLETKQLNVFERLYSDAMARVRRSDNFQKVTSSSHAQALLSTIQTIYGDEQQASECMPDTAMRSARRQSLNSAPSGHNANGEQLVTSSGGSLSSSWRDLVDVKPSPPRGPPSKKAPWEKNSPQWPAMEEPSIVVWSQRRMTQSLDSGRLKQTNLGFGEKRAASSLFCTQSAENDTGSHPKRMSELTFSTSLSKAGSTPTLPRLDSPHSFRHSPKLHSASDHVTNGAGCGRAFLSSSASATMLRGSFFGDDLRSMGKGSRVRQSHSQSPRFFIKGETVEIPGNSTS